MPSKRYRLKIATWIVVREAEEPSPRVIKHPEDAARLALEFAQTCDDDREHFWVVLLNTRHRYLMHTEVSVGTVKASLVGPREVFGPAVREGASSVLFCHNHPSGEPTPSAEDRELTRRLVECGKFLGIDVLDHVIVGNGSGRWFSFSGCGEAVRWRRNGLRKQSIARSARACLRRSKPWCFSRCCQGRDICVKRARCCITTI